MSALTKNNINRGFKDVHTSGEPYDVASGSTVYTGSMVLFDGTSAVVPAKSGTAGYFAGVCMRGNANDSTAQALVVNSGKHVFSLASATVADLGKLAYVSTDQDVVTSTSGLLHVYIVGRIVKIISSTKVLIDLSDRATGITS